MMTERPDPLNFVEIEALKEVILSAGQIVRRWYETESSPTYKEDASPLTVADTETDLFLKERLSQLLPQAGWLSEESKDDLERLNHDWLWVADPMDGTKEFVQKIPELAISVGLVYRGEVVMGGIVNPITDEGGIGTVHGRSHFWGIDVSDGISSSLPTAVASVSRTEVEDGSIAPYLNLVGLAKPIGSVAYKLLRVAAGRESLPFSVQPKSEWDICGGVGLLTSVGKAYRRLDGEPCLFDQTVTRIRCGAVASPEPLVDEFLAVYRGQS